MLETLKLYYPSVPDEVLLSIVDDCEQYLLGYCNLKEVPVEAEPVIVAMAKENLNQLNSEGIVSENAGGSSITYLEDYSIKTRKRLNQFKKIRTV